MPPCPSCHGWVNAADGERRADGSWLAVCPSCETLLTLDGSGGITLADARAQRRERRASG